MYGYRIFHEDILENLISNARCEKTQQAYIFEGNDGVGSYEASQLFAHTLVCGMKQSAPCRNCPPCLMALSGTHPDIKVIDYEPKKKNISVDQIRNLITDAYVKPFENQKKVYILRHGDDITPQAQNALLKILEEPPEYVVFIILTENVNSLLPTIRSRCCYIKFSPVSDELIKKQLIIEYPELTDSVDFIVGYAGGVYGNAEKLLEKEDFLTIREKAFEKLADLLSSNPLTAYEIADFADENKDDMDLILSFWLDFMRDSLLVQNDATDLIQNLDFKDKIMGFSLKYPEEKMIKAVEELITAQKMRKKHVSLKTLILRLAFTIKK